MDWMDKWLKWSDRPVSLRWTMIRSVSGIILTFWFLAMALLTWGTRGNIRAEGTEGIRAALSGVKFELTYNYGLVENRDRAALWLRHYLSVYSDGLYQADGGMAFRYYDAQTGEVVAVSQLAFGSGYSDGRYEGERLYLEFDSGLDDAGQLEFARKILERRETSYSYILYPASDEDYPGDGTFARVTGIEEPGGGIRVQRLTLVHPDGTEELLVETATQGDDPITVELKYMELTTVLAPLVWHSGDGEYYNGHIDLEGRLANFRAAQETLKDMSFGKSRGNITDEGGGSGASSGDSSDGMALGYAWEYQALPIAMYNLRWTYLITFALAVLLILWMSHRLTVRTARPLERLCTQVEDGKPCEPDTRLKEVNALADAFDDARKKLADDLRRQRDLTRAMAHELKTPAAVLRAYAEALGEDIVPEQRQEYLTNIVEESDRLAVLVDELLDLSRMEGSAGVLVKEPVDFTALVRNCFERLRLPMEERGLELTLELEPVTVEGDPRRLEQAAGNLAVNALRHASPGPVRVRLKREGEYAVLTTENHCPPIPPEKLNRIWEPFYKADESRSGEGGGLGLAVVKNIVTLHGGSCRAEPTPEGVQFRVELPG